MKIVSAIEVNENPSKYFIVDIREKYEYQFANINCLNIPMNEVCQRLEEFPKDKEIVLMCHSGNRATALGNLLSVDFEMKNICVLEGGISSWKELVDSSLKLD